jgi:N-acyl-D-aspartate/D-glutamate deacylase
MEALRKKTLMPAERLETRVPMMKTKGRLRPGANSDLTIFDAEGVIDKATYSMLSSGADQVAVQPNWLPQAWQLT